jgi:hypothetical protein
MAPPRTTDMIMVRDINIVNVIEERPGEFFHRFEYTLSGNDCEFDHQTYYQMPGDVYYHAQDLWLTSYGDNIQAAVALPRLVSENDILMKAEPNASYIVECADNDVVLTHLERPQLKRLVRQQPQKATLWLAAQWCFIVAVIYTFVHRNNTHLDGWLEWIGLLLFLVSVTLLLVVVAYGYHVVRYGGTREQWRIKWLPRYRIPRYQFVCIGVHGVVLAAYIMIAVFEPNDTIVDNVWLTAIPLALILISSYAWFFYSERQYTLKSTWMLPWQAIPVKPADLPSPQRREKQDYSEDEMYRFTTWAFWLQFTLCVALTIGLGVGQQEEHCHLTEQPWLLEAPLVMLLVVALNRTIRLCVDNGRTTNSVAWWLGQQLGLSFAVLACSHLCLHIAWPTAFDSVGEELGVAVAIYLFLATWWLHCAHISAHHPRCTSASIVFRFGMTFSQFLLPDFP